MAPHKRSASDRADAWQQTDCISIAPATLDRYLAAVPAMSLIPARSIPIGTLKSIIDGAGLTADDFR